MIVPQLPNSWSHENRNALTLVRRHSSRTGWFLLISWLISLLGLGTCLSPFAMILMRPVETEQHRRLPQEDTVRYLIGIGLSSFLLGTGFGLVFFLRLPGYRRTDHLIATADLLGLKFTFPTKDPSWGKLAQSLNSWPFSSKGICAVAGLFVGDHDGVRFALLEPSTFNDLNWFRETYIPTLYGMHQAKLFVLFPNAPTKEGILLANVSDQVVNSANQEGFHVEVQDQFLAVSTRGNLVKPEECNRLLTQALKIRQSLLAGTQTPNPGNAVVESES